MGRYIKEMVREFYASYVETLLSRLDRQTNQAKHAPLDNVRVRGKRVDISLSAIRRFLHGEDIDATRTLLTTEYDYRWKVVKVYRFQHELDVRETSRKWIEQHLSLDGEAVYRVLEPKGSIKKSNLTFTSRFLWLLV